MFSNTYFAQNIKTVINVFLVHTSILLLLLVPAKKRF